MSTKTIDQKYDWAETCLMIGCSMRTLQRLRANGLIGYTTIGVGKRPRVYFTQRHIDAFLASASHDVKAKRAST